ncbi:LysR family transcriptional regulator [Roseibium denhamense]|uniref:DNA-binding transcriptional regulator, LysR family n=1 Tax=Roseibium denhamense TaxID=76305 RepID=A0ABY1PRF6_9HYPH|nr:LysR family transcriptional regulator [Roseibium denhamense]MTI04345.1 LysR family transcriptional regulator [Roseibium denhamense]SMP37181.1 DNA-binding transcriptional regulator, LysR family [Roseibium denhamense]
MTIKIEMLRCFTTVAEIGNLAEAATRLGRTQSAISMTLKQLEENLGDRLFESDRKNRLTTLGEQVFELARSQLKQFDYTLEAIETCARSPEGLLRIASIPSVAAQVFPAAIAVLTGRHDNLSIELRDTNTQQVIDALVRGQADVGIVSGQHRINGISEFRLFADRFGLLCAADHPLARQKATPTFSEVISGAFIRNDLISMIETPAFREGIKGSRVSVQNTMSLIAMVRTGHWVTILPQSVTQFMSPDLAFRELADLPDRRQVSLLMTEKAVFPQFAEELRDFLRDFDWNGQSAAEIGDRI